MSSYRIASLAYPRQYWAEHGDEIIETANELSNDNWSFRESRQLVSNGLRTRSFEATGGDLRQVWVQGLAIFLFVALLQGLSGWLGHVLGLAPDNVEIVGPTWMFIALGLATTTFAISTKWPAMLFIAACLFTNALTDAAGPIALTVTVVAMTTIPIATFGNGRRLLSPAALAATLTLATASTGFWFFGPGLLSPLTFVVGLALVRFDPRLLAAATTYTAFVFTIMTVSVLFPDPNIVVDSVLGFPVELFIGLGALAVTGVLATVVNRSARRTTRLC